MLRDILFTYLLPRRMLQMSDRPNYSDSVFKMTSYAHGAMTLASLWEDLDQYLTGSF